MTRFVSASLRPSPRSLTRDRTRQRDALQLQFKSVWRPLYEHAHLMARRRARIRTRDHYCTSRWWNHHSIDGGSTDDGSTCPITHHPHAFHAHDPRVSIIYHTHRDRLVSTHLDPPAQLDPRHDGDGSHFARIRARADRDALGARAARCVDARCDDDGVRAFGIGRRKAVDARRRRRRRSTDRRSTEAGRGSDTRRRYAIGANGRRRRVPRARDDGTGETRERRRGVFYVYIDDRLVRASGASRAVDGTRHGRRTDERTIDRTTERWGDREVEGVSSIVES